MDGPNLARTEIVACCDKALAFDGADLIAIGLFRGRQLRHSRNDNIRETGGGALLWGDTSEAPGGALVIHDVAGAIYGIEDGFPAGIFDRSTDGEREGVVVLDAFHNDLHGLGRGPLVGEPFDDGLFGDFIYVKDGICLGDFYDAGKILIARTRIENGLEDSILQIAKEEAEGIHGEKRKNDEGRRMKLRQVHHRGAETHRESLYLRNEKRKMLDDTMV